jgi:hypothetical protein
MTDHASSTDQKLKLGIRENLGQFSLLVLINAFVGGMVGLERTIVPLLGSEEFRPGSTSAITAFIVSFGLTKALVDLVSGPMADLWGRKPVLMLGWLFGLPVPFLIVSRASRRESRLRMVYDSLDEDRSGGTCATRPRNGIE